MKKNQKYLQVFEKKNGILQNKKQPLHKVVWSFVYIHPIYATIECHLAAFIKYISSVWRRAAETYIMQICTKPFSSFNCVTYVRGQFGSSFRKTRFKTRKYLGALAIYTQNVDPLASLAYALFWVVRKPDWPVFRENIFKVEIFTVYF